MHDFIHLATTRLGISRSVGKSATSRLLGILESTMGEGEFESLTSALPGAASLLPPTEVPSVLGGISALTDLPEPLRARTPDALTALARSGLDLTKVAPFASLFLTYIKSHVGEEMLGHILSALPHLTRLDER